MKSVLENPINETYNVSSQFHLRNIDVVNKMCALYNKNPEDCIEYVKDRAGHDFKYSIDPSKMNRLGYSIKSDFDENIHTL